MDTPGWVVLVRDLAGTAGLLTAPLAYVLGGRRRQAAETSKVTAEGGKVAAEGGKANADAAASLADAAVRVVGVSETVLASVHAEMAQLSKRVEHAEESSSAAERRAHAAELHSALLLQALIAQRTAALELVEWADKASGLLRARGIDVERPPQIPELAVPESVTVTKIPQEG